MKKLIAAQFAMLVVLGLIALYQHYEVRAFRIELDSIQAGPKCGGYLANWTDPDGTKHASEPLPCVVMVREMNKELERMADAIDRRDVEIEQLKKLRVEP